MTVLNYKSFGDTGVVPLGAKFTVLVGQNNAGKTAFLESISPTGFQSKPHRIPVTEPYGTVPNPVSQVRFGVSLSGAELLHRFLTSGQPVWLPVKGQDSDPEVQLNDLFSRDVINFELEHRVRGGGWISLVTPSHQQFTPGPHDQSVRIEPTADRRSWNRVGLSPGNDELPQAIGGYLTQAVYLFRAERLNIGESGIEPSPELLPDARNLPSVLLQLPNNPGAHDRYLDFVREVFPSIYRVTSAPFAPNMARVMVIMNDPAGGVARPGVDVALNDSGTGISQVLAMLYVAVTAPTPRVIVIDEPNSFLHPGATRKLLTILARLDHQYVISTHSSEIIRTVDPEFVHLIQWVGTEAVVRTLDRANVHDQRSILNDLGVRLSDVFGADSVIWVEGPTEQHCFTLLLTHLGLLSPATVIVSLVATGDLEGRRPRATLVWQVYERLSKGTALVPPALAFSLDRRTDRLPRSLTWNGVRMAW
jgi:hypothetical protein